MTSTEWYKHLSLDQKLGLKECAHLLTGMRWEEYTILFSPRERLEILYDKLIREGYLTNEEASKNS
jgi:hypothetical protein